MIKFEGYILVITRVDYTLWLSRECVYYVFSGFGGREKKKFFSQIVYRCAWLDKELSLLF